MKCSCCGTTPHAENCPYSLPSGSFERWVAFEQFRQGQRDKENGYSSLAQTHPEETSIAYALGYEKGHPLIDNANPNPMGIGVIIKPPDPKQGNSLISKIWKMFWKALQ